MSDLHETILQFGTGGFLRAFLDLFVHHANQRGDAVGRIVAVQSTGDARANLLNQQHGRYHVVIRGMDNGQVIDHVEECASISRALVAATQWDEVLAVARSPDLKYIVCNTTEAGYALDSPASFPAKLRAVLLARWQTGQPPVTLMPCELIEDNAEKLRDLVVSISHQRNDPPAFIDWLTNQCVWLCSLVDRIVPGRPSEHPLLATDPLLLMAEPFALWALQDKKGAHPWFAHPAIVRTPDVKPYFLRKVRILNGAHTALVCHVGLDRFATVLEAMNDGPTVDWLQRLLFDEVVPVLEGRCDDAAGFAKLTLERFRNPFLNHKLADIAVNHTTKKMIRLEPTIAEYRAKFGKEPPLLTAAIENDTAPPGH
jgi:tagaturonate reductase